MNSGVPVAVLLLAPAFIGAPAWSADAVHAGHAPSGKTAPVDRETMWKNSLAREPLAMTAAFDAGKRLWLVTVKDGHVWISRSDNRGESFSAPGRVNAEPEYIAADGENRPKIAFGPAGQIYVSWTQNLPRPFSGNVRFARSLDGGRTFSMPVTINDNHEIIAHRFEALGVDRRGRVHLAWLDRRDQSAAEAKGEKYTGLAVYHAVSKNGGAIFSTNKKIADHSCECCRVALAFDTDSTPVVFWRHVFGQNVRDHALLRLDGKSKLVRVSHDNWEVDACPHHGPGLSIGGDGAYHIVWFTDAPAQPGLFYARSTDRGRSFLPPMRFGNPEAQAAHPQVLSLGKHVFLVWKEFDGQLATVRAMFSKDGGASWSEPLAVASAADASDHPLLITDGARAYVSWYAVKEGYRLLELSGERP